jgi:hypothetical protein
MKTKPRSPNAKELDKLLDKGGPIAEAIRDVVPYTTLREHRRGESTPSSVELLYVYNRYGFPMAGWMTKRQLKAAQKLVSSEAIELEDRGGLQCLTPEQRDAEAITTRFLEDREQ